MFIYCNILLLPHFDYQTEEKTAKIHSVCSFKPEIYINHKLHAICFLIPFLKRNLGFLRLNQQNYQTQNRDSPDISSILQC